MIYINEVGFIKWVGRILLGLGILIFLLVLIGGKNAHYLANRALYLLVYGTLIWGIGLIAYHIENLYGEMKFFRRHYIQKDNQVAKVLQNKENKE